LNIKFRKILRLFVLAVVSLQTQKASCVMLCSVESNVVSDVYEDRTAFANWLFVSLHAVPILIYVLHAVDSFLRGHSFLRLTRNTMHFMETDGSSPSPCIQQQDMCFYPAPDLSSPTLTPSISSRSILYYPLPNLPPFPSLSTYHNISPSPKAHQSVS